MIIAPDYEADARALLQKKKNLRLIQMLPNVAEAWLNQCCAPLPADSW